MKYIAGDYKNAPLGSANARRMTSNTAWTQRKEWDWAIIDLNKSFQTWQLFANGDRTAGREVMSIGYPCDKPDSRMYYDVNVIKSSDDKTLHVLCDTARGDSGGAIIDTETWRLIGIMSQIHTFLGKPDYEISVRINQDLYNRFVMHQQELKEETGF